MAKVIIEDEKVKNLGGTYSILRIAIIGVVSGLLYFGLTALLNSKIDSIEMSGNIATVLVAFVSVIAMMGLRMVQPLLVTSASGATLWGLSSLTNGLQTLEVVLWSAFLYAICYMLFSWMSRYNRVVPVLLVTAMIIISMRMIIAS